MEKDLKVMREDFEKVVNDYVATLLSRWEVGEHYCWWVSDRVGIDAFIINEEIPLSLGDIIYCVENNVSFDEVIKWWDYCSDCNEFNLHFINLSSWCKGAPRVSQNVRDELRRMKQEFEKACEDVKGDF